ncbi:TnsD family Tn7-like transposition protein [Desulfuromonas acetoxidans]|uniref:TnsD family Tn7-like transposition protein n=1 Tax=Desulfuromonas acetoxidans TaxID=891 RepID=UPI00292FE078|nr:TnsD family Tn7-like transposition protein [Desulfuromonas acetoxidans]
MNENSSLRLFNGQTLPFFPIPCEGETVYSVLGRYLIRSAEVNTQVLETLNGGLRAVPFFAAVPGFLHRIAAAMPKGHPWKDPQEIVQRHTTLSYFTYFDNQKEQSCLRNELTTANSTSSMIKKLGLSSYKCGAKPASPRYCPSCAKEEILLLGFPYFHREHQLPGVFICWKHKTPLAVGCRHCGPYSLRDFPIMPGKCSCEGNSPLMIKFDTDVGTESFAWLAEQSDAMLNSSSECNGKIRETLRRLAIEKGLSRSSLLDYAQLAREIDSRFGTPVLRKLGVPSFKGEQPAAWVRRLLYAQLDGKRRSPSLLFLLVIGALFDSLDEFEKRAEAETSTHPCEDWQSKDSEDLQKEERPVWADYFFNLQKKGLGLSGISSKLGIPLYVLIKEIRQQGWRIPLSKQLTKKLGSKKISAVKKDLRQGVVKKEIMSQHRCSEWALTLIELDEPEVSHAHKNAAQKNRREKNRQRLRRLLECRPLASRSDILEEASGLYDYMLKHDRTWFFEQIPKKEKRTKSLRGKRKDWSEFDAEKSREVSDAIDILFNAVEKPVYVTPCAVLKMAGMLNQYSNAPERFPNITKVVEEKCEYRSDFIRRRLAWAVNQMTVNQIPLSVNQLRRVAALPAQTVREFNDFITSYGCEIGAEFHERSYFLQEI